MSELGVYSAEEIISLTQDALNLANAACHFDKIENFAGAYDYYDKCILNIDEVMSKLPHTSNEWKRLMQLRMTYNERMDSLREIETYRSSFFKSSVSSLTSETTVRTSSGKFVATFHGKQLSPEDMNFTEMDLSPFTFEKPPTTLVDVPYWTLRNICRTIETGGYLTESFFIPKSVWSQHDVKFNGISAKTAAFEIIIKLITMNIENLSIQIDEASLSRAEMAILNTQDELIALQNQLAKPFPYIKEVSTQQMIDDSTSSVDDQSTHDEVVEESGKASSVTSSTTSSNVFQRASAANKSLASFVTALGKNVRKLAEVGLHRLAVALPSRLSAEELLEYTSLITRVCNKAQLLPELLVKIAKLKDVLHVSLSASFGMSQDEGDSPVVRVGSGEEGLSISPMQLSMQMKIDVAFLI